MILDFRGEDIDSRLEVFRTDFTGSETAGIYLPSVDIKRLKIIARNMKKATCRSCVQRKAASEPDAFPFLRFAVFVNPFGLTFDRTGGCRYCQQH